MLVVLVSQDNIFPQPLFFFIFLLVFVKKSTFIPKPICKTLCTKGAADNHKFYPAEHPELHLNS